MLKNSKKGGRNKPHLDKSKNANGTPKTRFQSIDNHGIINDSELVDVVTTEEEEENDEGGSDYEKAYREMKK